MKKLIICLEVCFLSMALLCGCSFGASSEKTEATTESTEEITYDDSSYIMGVYVLKDDKAESIADAKSYTFGGSKKQDGDSFSEAVEVIEKEVDAQITAKEYDSVTKAVDDLYEGQVQAVIFPKGYETVLEDTDDYEDFCDKTKLLYEAAVSGKSADEDSSTEEAAADNTPFIFYLSGSDTRSEMLDISRSDVNILAVVNPAKKQVLLVNTPRDYYIANPAKDGEKDKLTHCGIYGVDCSVQALEDLYESDITYYAQINFTGFEKLIDAIGGVTIQSDRAFDTNSGTKIKKGQNDLNGKEALALCRERYHLPDGDNDRGQNQMKVLKAVIEKMSDGALIDNYAEVMDSLDGMYLTNISSGEMADFAMTQFSDEDKDKWEVFTYAVYGTGGRNTTASMPTYNAYVMYPDEDTVAHAKKLISKAMSGKKLTKKEITKTE